MSKGFTLIEVLGVIIILGLISIVVTISVWPIIDDSKSKLSDVQKTEIEEAAKAYYLKEGMNSADFELDKYEDCVNVSELISKGYFDGSLIIDPKDSEEMTGSVKIIYKSNQYTYKYQEALCAE